MRLAPVDVNLLKHIELDAVTLRELLDLGIRARLLGPELITGEGEDGYVDIDVYGCAVEVSGDELLGVVAAVLEIVACVLVRLVRAVDLRVAAVAESCAGFAGQTVESNVEIQYSAE